MAVTDADIKGWLNENRDADDTKIANTMREAGVDPARMAQVTGLDYGDVAKRYEAALNPVSNIGVSAPTSNGINNIGGLSAITQGNNTAVQGGLNTYAP
jgi:hypothetical protein